MTCEFRSNLRAVGLSPVYTTSILGTALLNLGTRTCKIRHGTLNFCSVNGNLTGPRAEKFWRAETTSRGSLGPPKIWYADPKLITHALLRHRIIN